MPSNWKELVDNTRGKSADGFYDITKTWFEADSPPTPLPTHHRAQDQMPLIPNTLAPYVIVGTDATAGEADADNVSSIPVHNPNVVTQDDTLNEPTTQDTNEYVNFEEGSKMPLVLNLQTAGLRRSPRIAKLKRPWYKCNLVAFFLCIRCGCYVPTDPYSVWCIYQLREYGILSSPLIPFGQPIV